MNDDNDPVYDRIEDGIFDAKDVREILKIEIEEARSQAAFSRAHNLSRPCVSNVLAGKANAYGGILDALGLRAVTVYVAKGDQRFRTTPTKRRDDVQERWRVARSIAGQASIRARPALTGENDG